ncbi:MAG: hypothetical protein U9O20_00700 [Patescibacteria group bacterium]|nr:hypothetical protein [Patescibacteria group bacterium]
MQKRAMEICNKYEKIELKSWSEHEIVDVFWSSLVLAKKLYVNLKEKFYQAMNELDGKISNK